MELHGYQRLVAILLTKASVLFIGASYWLYGPQAQTLLQISHIIPLLFAGLMLRRHAVWTTIAAIFCTLLAGRLSQEPR